MLDGIEPIANHKNVGQFQPLIGEGDIDQPPIRTIKEHTNLQARGLSGTQGTQ